MKKTRIKSFGKINLTLKVLKRLKNGYHRIESLITFCELHDKISISENKKLNDKITFLGIFKKNISQKKNTITKLLKILRKENYLKNKKFNIDIEKKIPHGAGLGGGSSNAAALLNFFNTKFYLNIKKKKLNEIANQIGFDTPITLFKENTLINGRKMKITRIKKKFNLNILIVFPNIICSTKNIYKENKVFSLPKKKMNFNFKKNKQFISYLIKENNDLEIAATKLYPRIKKIINCIKSQDGCYFSRITGSGSACIGIFSDMKSAIYTKKLIRLKFPKYWSVTSRTI